MAKVGYFKINLPKNQDLCPILSFKRCLQQSIDEHLTAIAQFDPFLQDLLPQFTASEIPLTPILEPAQIVFRSAIAFKLALYSSLTVGDLASHFGKILANQIEQTPKTELLMKIEISDDHWLTFSCDYSHFQRWLASLVETFRHRSQPSSPQGITAHSPAAYCQYAHARACSVLRLIEQQNLGSVSSLPLSQFPSVPMVLPTTTRSLLEQLLRASDQLTTEKGANRLKVALHLSEAFLSFDKDFNLTTYRENANPNLGDFQRLLLINTRLILQEILRVHLNLSAPEEL